MSLGIAIFGVFVALFTSRLYAHDFWIEPTNFRPAVGDEVGLVLRVGQDLSGDRLPYINDWFSDYRVVAPDGARPVTGLMGDDPAGHFAALESGVHVIGYRSTRDFVEMKPEKFRSYLRDEGLESVITLRAERGDNERPAREYYSRCAKSLIDVGGTGQPGAWNADIGYTLELTPEANPYSLAPGEELPIRLRYLGEPIGGILVQAFVADGAEAKIALRTDDEGRVTLRPNRAGLWLIKAVHIIETPDDVRGAEWESYWASLTFRLPAREP
ncbi:MAG: DUF4198 domain-containing protein [Gammaproteobacteria bacterium]